MHCTVVVDQLRECACLKQTCRLVPTGVEVGDRWHVDFPALFQPFRMELVHLQVDEERHRHHINVFATRTTEVLSLLVCATSEVVIRRRWLFDRVAGRKFLHRRVDT